jgi:hypothetical protein
MTSATTKTQHLEYVHTHLGTQVGCSIINPTGSEGVPESFKVREAKLTGGRRTPMIWNGEGYIPPGLPRRYEVGRY